MQIKNKLSQLEDGRVYELSNAKMDGYLCHECRATKVYDIQSII